MLRGGQLHDIQLDPIRHRIFVIGDTNRVYVLHDVQGGVAEEPTPASPALASELQVQPTSGGLDLNYSIASPCQVDLTVHDQIVREVRQLVAEDQTAGPHRVTWDCRDRTGTRVPAGVYFTQLRSPALNAEQKVVVTR